MGSKNRDLHLPQIDDSIGDLKGVKLLQSMTAKGQGNKGAIRFGNPMKGNLLGLPSTQTF